MKEYSGFIPEITLKYKTGEHKKSKITSSVDSYNVFKSFYDADLLELQECFIVVFLNKAHNTIGWIKISSGGISGTVADPKIIMATALKCAASSVLLSHNHPSGNEKPSENDINLTKKIKSACTYFDIQLLDHIILTNENYYSFADNGII